MTRAGVSAVVTAALVLGCGGPGAVDRAYGGTVVRGHFVPPEAYAAFLRGAIAEADKHVPEAMAAYGEAARLDPASPEPLARMARLACRERGREADALTLLDHAHRLDPGYALAWEVEARCLLSLGRQAEAAVAASRAAALDPRAEAASLRDRRRWP